MLHDLEVSRALLLQGPNGPFFRRLANYLIQRGIEVTKVNFQPGDSLFFRGPEVVRYSQPMEEWPLAFRELVQERRIDGIFLFGDRRPMHRVAIRIANELGIPVWVFEEGYLRPDFVTIERGGVNGNSALPKDPDYYRRKVAELPPMPAPEPVGNTFYHHAAWAVLHSCALTFAGWRYPHYQHHRDVNSFRQAACWVRGGFRKLWYGVKERELLDRFTGEWSGRYFFVPLQVHCDSQLDHSDFASMEEFIDRVVSEFADYAPADTRLVLKHHPHDRAYRDYSRFLRKVGDQYGCGDRLIYVHDLHLPTILKHARGVITMNSTVGTSALHHGTPVKVLGRAIYDIPDLTYQGPLSEFFSEPGRVDSELFEAFCDCLRATSQINGSFYRILDPSNPTGLRFEGADQGRPAVTPENSSATG
jgi:capsule polysaccharide modification protein KpsS